MLGMSFVSFLVLTVIGAVVAVLYQEVIRYRFLKGTGARVGMLILGWIGAWLGSPVFGNWGWRVESVYIIPAIFGAAAFIHLIVLAGKGLTRLAEKRVAAMAGTKEEIRPKLPMAA